MGQKVGKAKPHAHRPLPVLVRDETLCIELCIGIKIAGINAVFPGETRQQPVFRTGSTV